MFNLTLVGDRELVGRLQAMPATVARALYGKVQFYAIKLQGYIITNKLSGQVLNKRSGDLKASIQQKVEASALAVYGIVYSSGDVKYAAIHEFGFEGDVEVKQHTRTMVFGKEAALPFSVGPYTMHMKMPERSYMRSSLTDMREEISTGLKEAAIAGAQQRAP